MVSKSNCTRSSVRCTFEAFLVLHQTSVCDINQHQHQFQYQLERSTWQKYLTLLYSYHSFTHLTRDRGNFLVTSSILVVFLLSGVQFPPSPHPCFQPLNLEIPLETLTLLLKEFYFRDMLNFNLSERSKLSAIKRQSLKARQNWLSVSSPASGQNLQFGICKITLIKLGNVSCLHCMYCLIFCVVCTSEQLVSLKFEHWYWFSFQEWNMLWNNHHAVNFVFAAVGPIHLYSFVCLSPRTQLF